MSPASTIAECVSAKKLHGFSGFPVTENGKIGGNLVGLISGRDIDFLGKDEYYSKTVSEVVFEL